MSLIMLVALQQQMVGIWWGKVVGFFYAAHQKCWRASFWKEKKTQEKKEATTIMRSRKNDEVPLLLVELSSIELPFADDARKWCQLLGLSSAIFPLVRAFYHRGLACPFQRSFAPPFSVRIKQKPPDQTWHVCDSTITAGEKVNSGNFFQIFHEETLHIEK